MVATFVFLDDYHESTTQSAHGGLIDFQPDRPAEEMADGKREGFFFLAALEEILRMDSQRGLHR